MPSWECCRETSLRKQLQGGYYQAGISPFLTGALPRLGSTPGRAVSRPQVCGCYGVNPQGSPPPGNASPHCRYTDLFIFAAIESTLMFVLLVLI